MNKGLIITGPAQSGKSMLAKWIADMHGKENTVWVDGREPNLSMAMHRQLSEHPDGALMIIDDLRDILRMELLLNIPTHGIVIHPQGKRSFHIPSEKLKVIVVVDHRLEDLPLLHTESLLRRFEIIESRPLWKPAIKRTKY